MKKNYGTIVGIRGNISEENPQIRMQVYVSSENDSFFCFVLGGHEQLTRGSKVVNSGKPIMFPVGKGLLGRVVNLFGIPLDGKGKVAYDSLQPIYYDYASTITPVSDISVLQTGIKVVDLFCPLMKGGKMGLF